MRLCSASWRRNNSAAARRGVIAEGDHCRGSDVVGLICSKGSKIGLIGQLLDRMTACHPPRQDPELKRDDYCELQEQFSDDALMW
jgi:hypothetical protein